MKILKRDGLRQPTKLEKRVSKIGTYDLVMWAENALFVIGKEITHHKSNPDGLDEAILGAEALLAIAKELKKRASNER